MGDVQEELKILQQELEASSSYDERAQLRKKMRELKKSTGKDTAAKRVGQPSYVRPGSTTVGPGKTFPTPSYLVPTTPVKKPTASTTDKKTQPTPSSSTSTTTTVNYRKSSLSSDSDKGRDTATPPAEKAPTPQLPSSVNSSSKKVTNSTESVDNGYVTGTPEDSPRDSSWSEGGVEHTSAQDQEEEEEDLALEQELKAVADEDEPEEPPPPVLEEPPSPVLDESPSPVLDESPSPVLETPPSPVLDEPEEPPPPILDEADGPEDLPVDEDEQNVEEEEEEQREPEPEEDQPEENQLDDPAAVEPKQPSPEPEPETTAKQSSTQKVSSSAKDVNELDGDFRSRLRTSAKTDTKPPVSKVTAEQVDFRNVLRRVDSPSTKVATAEPSTPKYQSAIRKKEPEPAKVTPSEEKPTTSVSADSSYEARKEERRRKREIERLTREGKEIPSELLAAVAEPKHEPAPKEQPRESKPTVKEQSAPTERPKTESKPTVKEQSAPAERPKTESKPAPPAVKSKPKEPKPVSTPSVPPKTAAERKVERNEEKKQEESRPPVGEESTDSASTEDSYEARRLARLKARAAKKNAASSSTSSPKAEMTYKQKREEELKKKEQENQKSSSSSPQPKGKSSTAQFQRQTSNPSKQLLTWAKHKTRFYENVKVTDFGSSWKNGLALAAIMHTYMPDFVPYDELTEDNPRANFEVAFAAAKEAGIPEGFEVDDVVRYGPDPKSMMTYLVTIYQLFN